MKRVTKTAAFSGGSYPAGDGESVTVLLSDGYVPDDAVGQSWADFFAGLIHNWELSTVTVYLAPYDEMVAICGESADACYDPAYEQMVLPGTPPPSGVPVEELAAHEFGHHIALNRENPPWSAYNWGTKRWASYKAVCPRVREGTAFPGAEDGDYGLNPGEAFAESYRVLNGGLVPWGIVDASWEPNEVDLEAIQDDVYYPYSGGTTRSWRKRFRPRTRTRWHSVRVATPLDGRLVARLRGHGSLDGDLYAYDAYTGAPLAQSRRYGRNETLRMTVCGPASIEVDVYRYRGSGSYSLQVTRP